jgi:hypothetical protein
MQTVFTTKEICDRFNARKVPTPSLYKAIKYGFNNTKIGEIWYNGTVRAITYNEIYIGNLVQHRVERSFYENISPRKVPSELQCRSDGIVPAIISRELWDKVQEIKYSRYTKKGDTKHNNSPMENIFKSVLVCSECGCNLQISKKSKKNIRYRCMRCRTGKISYTTLYDTLKAIIKTQIKLALDVDNLLKKLPKSEFEKENIKLKRQIAILQNKKFELFNRLADGKIDNAEYEIQKKSLESDIENLENTLLKNSHKPNAECLNLILKYKDFRKMTVEILNVFIAKVVVKDDDNIEIFLNFSDSLGKIESFINGGKSE